MLVSVIQVRLRLFQLFFLRFSIFILYYTNTEHIVTYLQFHTMAFASARIAVPFYKFHCNKTVCYYYGFIKKKGYPPFTFQLLDLCVLDVENLQFTYSVLAAAALYHSSSRELALSVSG